MSKIVEKKHIGTVCGHHEDIVETGDAYCVEFEDVQGDVCEVCFCEHDCIHDDCSDEEAGEEVDGCTDMGVNNPYNSGLTDYWYKGTLAQYKAETDPNHYYEIYVDDEPKHSVFFKSEKNLESKMYIIAEAIQRDLIDANNIVEYAQSITKDAYNDATK
jgi:hypothetical protein